MQAGSEKKESSLDKLDQEALERLRAFLAKSSERAREKGAKAKKTPFGPAMHKTGKDSGEGHCFSAGLFPKLSRDIPEEVAGIIVVPALKAVAPLFCLGLLLGIILRSHFVPLMTVLVLGLFLLSIISVRLFLASKDLETYYGFITEWKRDNSPSSLLSRGLSRDDIGLLRLVTRDPQTFKKSDVSYYLVEIEGERKPFRVPITTTNNPLPIGSIVKVYAGKQVFESKKEKSFERVYGVIDIDLETVMEDAGLEGLPVGNGTQKLVFVRDPRLLLEEERMGELGMEINQERPSSFRIDT